ncbi:substrate-binding domain-containing protein [Rhodoferax sp.]|uniref:substrate-binding domain-containing protein n=1 Tax=Rhodoferax sp. TaxID=50421 RepID=UPI0038666FB4
MSLAAMQQVVASASERALSWSGPETGPPAKLGITVAIVSEDFRNGGILGVAKGVNEALKVIGWKVRVYDAGGTPAGRTKALAAAQALKPDGLILLGVDAEDVHGQLQTLASRGVPMVGWHVGPVAGPMPGSPIAMNVSTNPLDVARITAMAAVVQSKGHAGVVVFTDSNFAIATAKANAMADIIRACQACELLEVRDVAISSSAELMPAVTQELLSRYGKRWTHALAINDIYFDYAAPALTKAAHRSDGISLLSAGDGSATAFLRIQAGTFQTGTVAEPVNLQGWQLVDELNRLLSHQPVTGHIEPVHLVSAGNIAFDGGKKMQYDPDNGYRDIYRRIWNR